ncbi:MAG TPA: hypothetical protein P5191_01925 [Ruminococcus sp.]|nr:hypothetical protein [Ruminococcus sp.]
MEIKAVKFRKDGFYTQPFVMGGEDGAEISTRISVIVAVCRTI